MCLQVSSGVAHLSWTQLGNSASSWRSIWVWLLIIGWAQVGPCIFILRLAEGTVATQGKRFSGNTDVQLVAPCKHISWFFFFLPLSFPFASHGPQQVVWLSPQSGGRKVHSTSSEAGAANSPGKGIREGFRIRANSTTYRHYSVSQNGENSEGPIQGRGGKEQEGKDRGDSMTVWLCGVATEKSLMQEA